MLMSSRAAACRQGEYISCGEAGRMAQCSPCRSGQAQPSQTAKVSNKEPPRRQQPHSAPPRGRWWLTCTVRGMRPSVCAWREGAQKKKPHCQMLSTSNRMQQLNAAGQDQQSSAAYLDAWRDDEVHGADPLQMRWADKRHVRMGRHVPKCLAAAAGVRTAVVQPHTHVQTHGQPAIRSSAKRSQLHSPPVWRACSGRAAVRPAVAGAGRSAQTAGPAPTPPAPAAGQSKQRCWLS